MKLSNQLRTSKIKLIIKEADEPKAEAKPYKLTWNDVGYHLKLISEKDDQGSTFYWPLPLRNPGEGISDPGNEFLVGKDGVTYDYAFDINEIVKWFTDHVPSSVLLDDGTAIDSQNLLDQKQILGWFSGKKVVSKPRALDVDEKPAAGKEASKEIKPSARFASAFSAAGDETEGEAGAVPKEVKPSSRFSKLDIDTEEDRKRQEEEDRRRREREQGVLAKESKKASVKSKNVKSDAFVNFIIERLKRKI
jgi:hypothetical protein